MSHWFLLSVIGRDKPGLVAELTQLIYDADANLEDSRMTILGSDFAVILLCSSNRKEAANDIAHGAKQLERDHGLTVLMRDLEEGSRPSIPAPGTQLYAVRAAGEDRVLCALRLAAAAIRQSRARSLRCAWRCFTHRWPP